MTTEKPDEGNQEPEEKIGAPTPTFTEGQGQPLGGDIKALQGSLETFQAEIRGQLKALQSDKDKRIPKLEMSLQDLMSEIARLKGKGFTDDEAVSEVEFRQNVKKLIQRFEVEQPSQATGTGVSGAAQDAQRVIEELKLNTGDPEVITLLSGKYRNYDHLRAEAALLVARKSTKPVPSSAATSPIPGGAASSEATIEELVSRFDGAKKYPTSPEYKAVKAELEKRGWK